MSRRHAQALLSPSPIWGLGGTVIWVPGSLGRPQAKQVPEQCNLQANCCPSWLQSCVCSNSLHAWDVWEKAFIHEYEAQHHIVAHLGIKGISETHWSVRIVVLIKKSASPQSPLGQKRPVVGWKKTTDSFAPINLNYFRNSGAVIPGSHPEQSPCICSPSASWLTNHHQPLRTIPVNSSLR
jgi:hypothetical protein